MKKKSLSKLNGWKRFVRHALGLFRDIEALALRAAVVMIFFYSLWVLMRNVAKAR